MKFCTRCKKTKTLDDFYRNKGKSQGRAAWCKKCHHATDTTAQARIKKWKNTEKGKTWQRKFNAKRKLRYNSEQALQFASFEWMLRRRYRIDVWMWAHMFNDQDRRCASCRDPLLFGRETAVDHCHETNRVRALLCRGCNLALGYVKDNPVRLQALIDYLVKHAHT